MPARSPLDVSSGAQSPPSIAHCRWLPALPHCCSARPTAYGSLLVYSRTAPPMLVAARARHGTEGGADENQRQRRFFARLARGRQSLVKVMVMTEGRRRIQ